MQSCIQAHETLDSKCESNESCSNAIDIISLIDRIEYDWEFVMDL